MSKLIPSNWSVVVAGKWNRSILTPKGVGRYVFDLKEGQEVSVLIPLDAFPIPIVKHPDHPIRAKAESNRLYIGLEISRYEVFEHAAKAGCNAIGNLPKTPLSAAGLNVDFRSKGAVNGVAQLLACEKADNALTDNDMTFGSREIKRSVMLDEGRLNLTIESEMAGGCGLRFNFHREATNTDALIDWLETPQSKIESVVQRVLAGLGLEDEVEWGDSDDE